MSSPITLSGFNNSDFSSILNAVMQQERRPVAQLESQQAAYQKQKSGFASLASKLSSLQSAASGLTGSTALQGRQTTISNTQAVAISGADNAPIGSYNVVVQQLARAQVSLTSSTHADRDTTVVAGGGSLQIGSATVALTGNVTLDGLASAINNTASIPVTASVVKNGANYQLVLTGNNTGADNAFTITNNLTGGSGVAFSGTTAQDARDGRVSVNNVVATSSSNTFENVVPGASLTAYREDAGNPVTILISGDSSAARAKVQTFVTAYNDLAKFVSTQGVNSQGTTIGGDPLVRSLRSSLSSALSGSFSVGGQYANLAEVGIEFTRGGELNINTTRFDEALSKGKADLERLFTADGGVFKTFESVVDQYTDVSGFLPSAQTRINTQLQQVSKRIGELESRLAIRRDALQREFTAADLAIQRLNSQQGSLGQLGGQYRLF